MRVPPTASVSVSSNDGGGGGGGGGRFAIRVCKIAKNALVDDTGGVVGSSLSMKSLTRAVFAILQTRTANLPPSPPPSFEETETDAAGGTLTAAYFSASLYFSASSRW